MKMIDRGPVIMRRRIAHRQAVDMVTRCSQVEAMEEAAQFVPTCLAHTRQILARHLEILWGMLRGRSPRKCTDADPKMGRLGVMESDQRGKGRMRRGAVKGRPRRFTLTWDRDERWCFRTRIRHWCYHSKSRRWKSWRTTVCSIRGGCTIKDWISSRMSHKWRTGGRISRRSR